MRQEHVTECHPVNVQPSQLTKAETWTKFLQRKPGGETGTESHWSGGMKEALSYTWLPPNIPLPSTVFYKEIFSMEMD